VGKSNIAYTIAKVLSQSGASVGLMDADIYGPSQALLTGTADYKPESISVDGHNRMIPAEVDGVKVFSIAYLVGKSDPIAWRGPMLSSAIKQFMQDVEWGNLDYLIVDMPPGTGDVQITLAQSLALTGVVMVTTPQDIAVSDARRALMMFKMQGLQIPILGIIENMSWFETPDVPSKKYFIFGKKGGQLLSEETQTPFLGSIPIVEDLTGPSDNRDDSNTSHSLIYKNVLHITGQMVREIARVQSGKSPQPI
jgi:ATP-binding protein involved in chromosome partitioning